MSAPPEDPALARVMSGEIWEELCETLRRSAERVVGEGVPDDPASRAEGFLYLTRFLAAGINFCVAHADPDHPELTRMMDLNMRWGLDCPDCLYLVCGLRGDAEYRVWGDAGSANHLDVQVNEGHYADGAVEAVKTVSSANSLSLERGAAGEIEIILGGSPRPGNWLPLSPDTQFLHIRQYFDDWERERPADLLIERIDGEIEKPRLRTDEIAARFDRLRSWIEKGGLLWENMSKAMLGMEPNSIFVFAPERAAEHSGMSGQAYCQGNFQCGPDEAVILELEIPACRHWSVSLANWYWEAIDFATRQSSLNGHQARIDDDGVVRAVIAHRDPGVPNWLDTSGVQRGTLIVRVLLGEGRPEARSRVVPFDSLRDSLPASTPTITATQRRDMLARRREAIWRRYRR